MTKGLTRKELGLAAADKPAIQQISERYSGHVQLALNVRKSRRCGFLFRPRWRQAQA